MAGMSPGRAMSTSRVARRGTAPCPLAFPTRPACANCRAAPCFPALLAHVSQGLLLYVRGFGRCHTRLRHVELELLLGSSSLFPSWQGQGRGWGLLSLLALFLPCCRCFPASGRVPRCKPQLQSPSPSVASLSFIQIIHFAHNTHTGDPNSKF